MPNIIDILARALSLRQETALNSITPNRAGGIMYDTLLVLNQMQLEGGSLLISKVYASVSAMEADTTPTSDLTGRALKPGQLVVIVTSDSSSSDMGSEYRFNGPGSWTYVGKVGGLPLDTVPTQSSTKGITSGGVYAALSAMKAEGYKYMGIATPGSGGTAPGTPNQPVFYIAGPGSYPNFGSITVASGYLGFIKYSSGSWSVESVAVGKDYDAQISALDGQISQLEAKVDGLVLSRTYPITQGAALNTGGVSDQILVNVNQGDSVEVVIDYPLGTASAGYTGYLMSGASVVLTDNNVKNGIKRTLTAPSAVTGIAINITATKAVATGSVKVSVYVTKGIKNVLENTATIVERIYSGYPEKVDGRASTNLFDKNSVTTGYFITPSTGLPTANANYSASDYIKVEPGAKYCATIISNSAYYDRNKNWLAAVTGGSPITIPSNVEYIRLSVQNSNLDTFQFCKGETLPEYEPYRSYLTPSSFDGATMKFLEDSFGIGYLLKLREHLSNPFVRTKIKLLGDSITAGMGGTGYSETGETIYGENKANVLTATCWSNMLYHYVDSVYNKDTAVEINDPHISIDLVHNSITYIGQSLDGRLLHLWRVLSNNNTAGRNIITFSFFGDHFSLRVGVGPNRGIADIVVDGVTVSSIDLYAETEDNFAIRDILNLSGGLHSVAVVETNTKNASSSGKQVALTGAIIPKSAIVKPWGISGSQSRAFVSTLTDLVSVDDDFVFLMYGTNDRHLSFSPDTTYNNLVEGITTLLSTYKAIPILMCASPCAASYETSGNTTRYFHMWDVHDAVARAGKYFGMPFIDNYTAFIEWAEQKGITTDELLHDGLHPNDAGYKVMFANIMKSLGLARLPYYLEWTVGE